MQYIRYPYFLKKGNWTHTRGECCEDSQGEECDMKTEAEMD
jgi:hypothetical protein